MVKQTHSQPGQVVEGKLSPKSLGFDKLTLQKLCINDTENEHFLYRLIGVAVDLQEYKSKFEDKDEEEQGYGLVGQWQATKNDGENVGGIITYIPGPLHALAVAGVKSGNDVRLALDVYVKHSDKAGPGYTFVVRTLMEPENNAIREIEGLLGNVALPALPSK